MSVRAVAGITLQILILGCSPQVENLSPEAALQLQDAVAALRESDLERALALADSAVALAPHHPHSHFVQGQAYYALAEFAAARSAWERVVTLEPRNWAWWQSLGDVTFRQQEYASSLRYYKRSLRLHSDPVSWHGAAGVYWELGRPLAARRACARALAVDSAYAPAYLSLSLIAEHAGELEQALRFAEQSMRHGPGEMASLLAAGRLHRLLGNPHEAIPLLQKALRGAPQSVEAHYNMAQALQDAGRAEQAARVMAGATVP